MNRFMALGVFCMLTIGQAFAQGAADADARNYPNRMIHMLVPFPPGGPADLIARFIGQKMSEDTSPS